MRSISNVLVYGFQVFAPFRSEFNLSIKDIGPRHGTRNVNRGTISNDFKNPSFHVLIISELV